MFFLKCLHFLNAIEIWLNFHLNNKNEVQNINQLLSHDQINKIVEGIFVHRKLFIRGLKFHTTSETLYRTFSTYGEIEKAFMVIDKSGLSKEYDFMIFKNVRSALMALKEPHKNIDEKITITKIAKSTTRDIDYESLRTIYVSNVPRDMFPGKLYEYFSSYGVIEKGPFGYNKQSGKSKGYAIFVYRTLEGAKSAIYKPNKRVDGHYLTCEMAIPRKMMKNRTLILIYVLILDLIYMTVTIMQDLGSMVVARGL